MNKLKYLKDDEDAALLAVLERDGSRDALMLLILRFCGMRPSELLGMVKKDLDLEHGEIFVHGQKGSDSRELPVREDLFKRLVGLAEGLKADERVFRIGYQRLVQIWHFYRPVRKPLKSLRHTLAVSLYRKTRDILIVKKVLGHRELASTMIYQTYVQTREELRGALL